MKVLIDHHLPFSLAHGGLQIQIEQTKAALEKIGIEVEFLRFWDQEQKADVLHFFGRCSPAYIELARRKRIAVVMLDLLSETGSRSWEALLAQKSIIWAARRILPASFLSRMGWDSFRAADAVVVGTSWEAKLTVELFGADNAKLHVVPNGVEGCFFSDPSPNDREDYLVSTATITPRKRVVELAEAAVAGKVKVRIVGKPYSEQDPYYQRFVKIWRSHPEYVEYTGPISDREELAGVYSRARGFVLLSIFETLSLSALEAAATGSPLLLADLPWARSTFGNHAVYCSPRATAAEAGRILRKFSDTADMQPRPLKPLQWVAVAERFKRIYESVLLR